MSTGFASSPPAENSGEHKHILTVRNLYHLQNDMSENSSLPNYIRLNTSGGTRDASNQVELTTSQRMLAACSGSLLTSLLVTPLDVVRVRLQAQQHIASEVSAPAITPSSSPSSSSTVPLRAHKFPLSPIQFQSTFARLPQQLGVTTCCREVFWVNGAESEFYAASGPSVSSPTPSSTSNAFADARAIEEHSRRRFTGTWEGLVKIARYEGLTSLWRGLSPTLIMAIPANVIYFTGYDSLKSSPLSPFSELSPTLGPLLAGSTARTIAATAISPLELFRTRLWAYTTAVHPDSISGEVSAFRKTLSGLVDMVKAEGWTTLWRGLSLTLWRDVPFSGIYWFGVEKIKSFLKMEREKHQRFQHLGHFHVLGKQQDKPSDGTFADSFIAGGVSGAVAAFLTTPFDVGKTRIQVSQVTSPPPPSSTGRTAVTAGYAGASNGLYKSMPSFLYGIYHREGVRGLWKGCVPRMLKVAPACAIMISTYDVGKQWAAKMNHRKKQREN